jgi:hypothetical protein
MNQSFCAREADVLAALQSGTWSRPSYRELREHSNHCVQCADTVAVAEFLQHEAELVRNHAIVPSVGLVWWKGQLAAKRRTQSRTTRPLNLVWTLAIPAAFLIVFWRALVLSQTPSSNGGLTYLMHRPSLWAGTGGEAALFAVGATLVCLLFGSLYLAWAEK